MKQIVALGGGGFSMEPDNLVLDQYILNLTGKERPKVCFLPQASVESQIYVVNFYKAFTELNAIPSWLSLFGSVPHDFADSLLQQDVIYVGGGNTKSMLALWRAWGVDEILKQAYQNGTILAGISAGAICWFEECVTDSVYPLGTIDGLGLLKGSACPHYDGEADRRPKVLELIKDNEILPCTALYDYAASHYIDGELHKVITSRENAKAFHVSLIDGDAHETPLKTEFLSG